MERPMKVVGVVGSPRKGGNTELLVKTALEGAASLGEVDTELVLLHGKKIQPCNACAACWKKEQGVCVIKDDADEVIAKLVEADGIVMGTPVYFGSASALIKALIERCLKVNVLKEKVSDTSIELTANLELSYPFSNKVGGAIAVGGAPSGGQERAIGDLHAFFFIMDMLVVADGGLRTHSHHPHYGGVGRGNRRGEVQHDEYGMQSCLSLGMRVAEAAKLIRKGLQVMGLHSK